MVATPQPDIETELFAAPIEQSELLDTPEHGREIFLAPEIPRPIEAALELLRRYRTDTEPDDQDEPDPAWPITHYLMAGEDGEPRLYEATLTEESQHESLETAASASDPDIRALLLVELAVPEVEDAALASAAESLARYGVALETQHDENAALPSIHLLALDADRRTVRRLQLPPIALPGDDAEVDHGITEEVAESMPSETPVDATVADPTLETESIEYATPEDAEEERSKEYAYTLQLMRAETGFEFWMNGQPMNIDHADPRIQEAIASLRESGTAITTDEECGFRTTVEYRAVGNPSMLEVGQAIDIEVISTSVPVEEPRVEISDDDDSVLYDEDDDDEESIPATTVAPFMAAAEPVLPEPTTPVPEADLSVWLSFLGDGAEMAMSTPAIQEPAQIAAGVVRPHPVRQERAAGTFAIPSSAVSTEQPARASLHLESEPVTDDSETVGVIEPVAIQSVVLEDLAVRPTDSQLLKPQELEINPAQPADTTPISVRAEAGHVFRVMHQAEQRPSLAPFTPEPTPRAEQPANPPSSEPILRELDTPTPPKTLPSLVTNESTAQVQRQERIASTVTAQSSAEVIRNEAAMVARTDIRASVKATHHETGRTATEQPATQRETTQIKQSSRRMRAQPASRSDVTSADRSHTESTHRARTQIATADRQESRTVRAQQVRSAPARQSASASDTVRTSATTTNAERAQHTRRSTKQQAQHQAIQLPTGQAETTQSVLQAALAHLDGSGTDQEPQLRLDQASDVPILREQIRPLSQLTDEVARVARRYSSLRVHIGVRPHAVLFTPTSSAPTEWVGFARDILALPYHLTFQEQRGFAYRLGSAA